MDAPGYSIGAFIANSKDHTLETLVGEPTINVLRALRKHTDPEIDIRALAKTALDPASTLRTPWQRDLVVGSLPIVKARELAKKLAIKTDDKTLYSTLVAAARQPAHQQDLFSFFGIVEDERAPGRIVPPVESVSPNFGLFPHQARVAQRAIAALENEPYRTIVHMPTGAGKTRTAMHIVAEFLNKKPDRLVVWTAQSAELLDQAAAEFRKAWSNLGSVPINLYRLWGENDIVFGNQPSGLLVAGLAKLNALLQREPRLVLILADHAMLTVIDEAHQAVAPTYRDLLNLFQRKKPKNALLGLTATPGRTWADINVDEELAEFFSGQKIMLEVEGYSNPVEYLIDEGYLARPSFYTLNAEAGPIPSTEDMQVLASEFDVPEQVLTALATDDQRNIQIIRAIDELAKRHLRTIVFAASVGHAHLLSSILNIRGVTSFVVTGETDRSTRERIVTKFRSSDPNPLVLCNFGVLTTGFDAPKTSAALIARPTRSLVLYSQMVGRAIRGVRAGGNATAEIVTVVDPQLPGFGDLAEAFTNWEDVWGQ